MVRPERYDCGDADSTRDADQAVALDIGSCAVRTFDKDGEMGVRCYGCESGESGREPVMHFHVECDARGKRREGGGEY